LHHLVLNLADCSRRWELVAHALSIILDTCPHDPTLLSLVLETHIAYGLAYEARLSLRTLLQVAIPSNPCITEPLCHPAHVNYLSDLLHKWMTPPVPSPHVENLTSLSISIFLSEVVDAMEEHATPALWTSKAVRDLARELRSTDFPSFVRLASCLSSRQSVENRLNLLEAKDDMQKEMDARLVAWIGFMLEELHRDDDWLNVAPPEQSRNRHAVLQFLVDIYTDSARISNRAPADEVNGAIFSLTCLCLASIPQTDAHAFSLVALLRDAPSSPTTFDALIRILFPAKARTAGPSSHLADAASAEPGALGSPLHIMHALRTLARALRAHGLRRAEAALWACALAHLESDWLTPRALAGRDAAVADMRIELVRRAEAAERARRGRVARRAKENVRARGPDTPAAGTGWVWEDFAGCWMRETPARPGALGKGCVVPVASGSAAGLPTEGHSWADKANADTDGEDDPGDRELPDSPTSARILARRHEKGKAVDRGPPRRSVLLEVNGERRGKATTTSAATLVAPKRKLRPSLDDSGPHPAPVSVAPSPSPFKKRARFAAAPFAAAPQPNGARRYSAHTPRAYKVLGMSPARAVQPAHRRWSAHTPRATRLSFAPAPSAAGDDDDDAHAAAGPRPAKRRWSAHTPHAPKTTYLASSDDDLDIFDAPDSSPVARRVRTSL
jgi:hypothetical protein